MLVKFFSSTPDIFVIILVIKKVSSIVAENPLVEVEAFPRTAPTELTVEHEYKLKKINKQLIIFTN